MCLSVRRRRNIVDHELSSRNRCKTCGGDETRVEDYGRQNPGYVICSKQTGRRTEDHDCIIASSSSSSSTSIRLRSCSLLRVRGAAYQSGLKLMRLSRRTEYRRRRHHRRPRVSAVLTRCAAAEGTSVPQDLLCRWTHTPTRAKTKNQRPEL